MIVLYWAKVGRRLTEDRKPEPAKAGFWFLWYTVWVTRFVKQLLFGGIFLAIIGGIGWWFFRLAVPAPSCTDGIQNGQEEGLDCGTVCGKSCPAPVQSLTVAPVVCTCCGSARNPQNCS